MKLTHVFGLVVSVHVAVFTVIFATPGCRSTGKQKPRPEDTDPAQASTVATPVDAVAAAPVESMSYSDINAGGATGDYAAATPVAPTEVSAVTPVSPEATGATVRFAPTRPSATTGALAPAAAPVAASASYTVGKGDSLWSIARKHGITVAELAAANKLAPSATLRLGQTLTVPAMPASDASVAAATDAGNTYTVVAGDTLGAIARRQGTTVAALRTANNLSGDNLRVGQKLVVPGNAAPLSDAAPRASAASAATAPRAGGGSYTVVSGDTLGAIARRAGVKVGDLALLNNITDPAKLRVGQTLKLPAGAKTPSASRPAAAASTPAAAPTASVGVAPEAPVEATGAVAPVEPVTPVEPMAIPVIRIDE
ncbi:MAG: LysM peptidoglycan-binding domain-containing protein [Opitutaceae bacterium]|jgi:LysM repeat protein|nr:LysM peptidoglycan-binding domain-containing protein [Opitutaceae bacterium]